MGTLGEWRKSLFTRRVFDWVQGVLPPLSQTEKEALSAGTVGWEQEIFSGNPDFSKLFALPPSRLTSQEEAFLEGPTAHLCRMIDDWTFTSVEREIPERVWDYLKSEGFMGLRIPKPFGGKGFSAYAASQIVMKIASRSPSVAVCVIVPNSLGPGELLDLFGTKEQQEFWLPKLAQGSEIPAFALTSLVAGSDATSLQDHGVVVEMEWEGEKTLGIRLTWSKRYISLAPVCTVLGLAFRLSDPDHLLGEVEDLGITVALVPSQLEGVKIGAYHYPAHQVFPNGPTSGEGVTIPLEWVIGGRAQVGKGWTMLVTALAAGRGVMLPSMAVAGMKMAAFSAGSYGRVREQFHLPIGRFEGVEEVLGALASRTYVVDCARRLTLQTVDAGGKPALLSAIMKYHGTTSMRSAVDSALDVLGGKGIMDGPKNLLASAYRAVPIGITVEGANILTRSLMIYGQGIFRSHPFLQAEMDAVHRGDLDAFDRTLCAHIGFLGKTALRALWRGWTFGALSRAPRPGPTARYFRQIKRLSATFALMGEGVLALYGGKLKRKEAISGRFSDALGEMILAASALKRFCEEGEPCEDLPLLDHGVQTCLERVDRALYDTLDNLPNFFLRTLLRVICYPLGMVLRPPRDTLGARSAQTILRDGQARDKVISGIFIDEEGPSGALDRVFRARIAQESLRQKVRESGGLTPQSAFEKGIISEEERKTLEALSQEILEVCEVDVFSSLKTTPLLHRQEETSKTL